MTPSLTLLRLKIQNELGESKIKRIEFEGFDEPVRMGVHSGFSHFFKLEPEEPLPSTLDYVVAAVGACLAGTLSGALGRRGIPMSPEKLQAEAEGQLEVIEGKLLLTKIAVSYRLKVPKEKRAEAQRVLEHHASVCPVSESVRRGIQIEWTGEIKED